MASLENMADRYKKKKTFKRNTHSVSRWLYQYVDYSSVKSTGPLMWRQILRQTGKKRATKTLALQWDRMEVNGTWLVVLEAPKKKKKVLETSKVPFRSTNDDRADVPAASAAERLTPKQPKCVRGYWMNCPFKAQTLQRRRGGGLSGEAACWHAFC